MRQEQIQPEKEQDPRFEEKEAAMKPDRGSAAPAWLPIDTKIIRKLDFLIIPMVTMVYLLAFLDRANIGNARVVSTPYVCPMHGASILTN